MQTTNPKQTSLQKVPLLGAGKQTLKSFDALKEARIAQQIAAFVDAAKRGLDGMLTAGTLLVEMCREQPDIFKRIRAEYPLFSESELQTFARIGRGELLPQWLLDPSMGARKMLECSIDVQKEYLAKPIEVVVHWKNGETKIVKKAVNELSKAELPLVYNGKGGVNLPPQQEIILKNGVTPPPKDPPAPYRAQTKNVDVGSFVIYMKDGELKANPCSANALCQRVLVSDLKGKAELIANITLFKRVTV